jgi:hypothetical protein
MLHRQVGTNPALAESALDVAVWGDGQMHSPYTVVSALIETGVRPHYL